MSTVTGFMSSTAYTKGTQDWIDAVKWDFQQDLITDVQMIEMLKGYSDPKTGQALPSAWGTITAGVGDAVTNLASLYLSYSKIEMQREIADAQFQAAKNNLALGIIPTEPVRGFGGINLWTLLAFGGLAVAAMLLLKSR